MSARLDLKVGFSCNNRCVFCVQGDKRDHVPDRSTAEVERILEERRAHTDGVVFTGGEATIRRDIVALIARASALGYRTIQLQTNGRRLSYRPFVAALVEAGLTEVAPALHGSTAPIHDALVRSRGAFAQVVKGIRNVRAARLPVITNSVVVRDNVVDLPRLTALLCALGVQQLQLAFVHPAGSAETGFHDVVPRFEDAAPSLRRALAIARRAGVPAFTEAVPYCFMHGLEAHVVEARIPETCVVDAPIVIEDYTGYRWTEGKAKGPPCQDCSFAAVCEGPWREYPREYGWDAFTPRADDPAAFGLAARKEADPAAPPMTALAGSESSSGELDQDVR